jgi:hypothetical protein
MIFADIAAGACALLFLAAVFGKLDSWESWSRLTAEFPGPHLLRRVIRLAVPATEGAVVVLIFASPKAGLAAGAALLLSFAVAVQLLARRLAGRECNCFGAIAPATLSPRLAARNIAFAVAAALGGYAAWREHMGSLTVPDVAATLLAGAILLMVVQYRDLHQTTSRPRAEKEAR